MYTRIFDKKLNTSSNFEVTKVCVFRQSSQVDQFYREEGISSTTGKKVVFYRDPLIMLFNQQRLNKLGLDGVTHYVESLMQQSNNPLSELRKNCSDADLLATIKSRHLQSPSEILAWSRYMSRNMKEFETAVQNAKAELEQQNQTTLTASAE